MKQCCSSVCVHSTAGAAMLQASRVLLRSAVLSLRAAPAMLAEHCDCFPPPSPPPGFWASSTASAHILATLPPGNLAQQKGSSREHSPAFNLLQHHGSNCMLPHRLQAALCQKPCWVQVANLGPTPCASPLAWSASLPSVALLMHLSSDRVQHSRVRTAVNNKNTSI